MNLQETLARIDAASTCCVSCERPLDPDGPDDTFCSEVCQARWHRRRADPLAAGVTLDSTLLGFTPPDLDAFSRAMAEMFEQMRHSITRAFDHAFGVAAETMRGLQADLVLIDELEPDDRWERALWLRRHRNTGPSTGRHTPRTLGTAHTASARARLRTPHRGRRR